MYLNIDQRACSYVACVSLISMYGSDFVSVFFFKQKTAYEIASCLVGSEMCIRDRTTGVSPPDIGIPRRDLHDS